ncbi:MAG: GNAT family N-acetyltransferase [Candidatus Woesearchaeota archaeon]
MMKHKIAFLDDANLREFIDYLEKIPYSAYPKNIILDEKDLASFRYYHGNRYIVAFDCSEKNNIIGHLCIMTPATKYGYHQEHIVEVHINVIPEYQNKGIGKALLEFFIEEVKKGKKKSGIRKIKTKMLAGNEKVIRLFERFGFKKEALLKDEWKMIIESNRKSEDNCENNKKVIYEDGIYMSLIL